MFAKALDVLRSSTSAIIVLSLLAVGLALSTVCIAYAGGDLPSYLSHAVWLRVLLGLLVVILGASMARPAYWRRSKAGLLVAHGGLLVIVLGAAVTWRLGKSGLVVLGEGETTGEMLLRDRYEIQMDVRTVGSRGSEVLRLPRLSDGAVQRVVRAPQTGVAVAVLAWLESARPKLEVRPATGSGNAFVALRLSVQEPYAKSETAFWLVHDGQYGIQGAGGLRFELRVASKAEERDRVVAEERGLETPGIIVHSPLSGENFELPDRAGEKVALTNPAAEVHVLRVFEHWVMGMGEGASEPADLKDGPKNPAVEVEIVCGDQREKRWVFALHEDWQSRHTTAKSEGTTRVQVRYRHPGDAGAMPRVLFVYGPEDREIRACFRTTAGSCDRPLKEGDHFECLTYGGQTVSVSIRELLPRGVPHIVAEPDVAGEGVPAVNLRISREGTGDAKWVFLGSPEFADLGPGGMARLVLRRQTRPLDFDVTLRDVIADFYPDSGIPRAYESHIEVYDPLTGARESGTVSMNHPFRFHGLSFYQNSYRQSEQGEETTLEVAGDPFGSWLILGGAVMVLVGLLLLYAQRVRRVSQPVQGAGVKASAPAPTALLLVALCALCTNLSVPVSAGEETPPAPPGGAEVECMDGLTVLHSGRLKPFASFAQEYVRYVFERRTFHGQSPVQTALSLLFEPEKWVEQPIFFAPPGDARHVLSLQPDTARISAQQVLDDGVRERMSLIPRERGGLREQVNALFGRASAMSGTGNAFGIFPVSGASQEREWFTPNDLIQDGTPVEAAAARVWQEARQAYRSRNMAAFGQAIAEFERVQAPALAAWRGAHPGVAGEGQVRLERWLDKLALTRRTAWFYLLVFVVSAWLCLRGKPSALRASLILLALPFLVHTAALGLRWKVSGYMPLTSLFESGVVLAWGGVLLGGIFAALRRSPMLATAAAFVGALVMFLMENMPVAPSEIRPLQAVLNSYWLDIHVVVCMVSYGGLLVAAVLGSAYLGRPLLTRWRGNGAGETELVAAAQLEEQMYKLVVCSWILLAGGIITGAIWAHHAWGRYWGWDPKEVWSLVTWVVYAIYLHTRVFLRWRGWKSALFAVLAFGAVVFTYFGVSFLLPGLHSYAR